MRTQLFSGRKLSKIVAGAHRTSCVGERKADLSIGKCAVH